MNYVLETNLIIHLVRKSDTWQVVDLTYDPLGTGNRTRLTADQPDQVLGLGCPGGSEIFLPFFLNRPTYAHQATHATESNIWPFFSAETRASAWAREDRSAVQPL